MQKLIVQATSDVAFEVRGFSPSEERCWSAHRNVSTESKTLPLNALSGLAHIFFDQIFSDLRHIDTTSFSKSSWTSACVHTVLKAMSFKKFVLLNQQKRFIFLKIK